MNFTWGDIAVGITCTLAVGVMIGTTFKPEPKFAACVEIKPMPEPKPLTEKQKIKMSVWMMRDRGVILK